MSVSELIFSLDVELLGDIDVSDIDDTFKFDTLLECATVNDDE